MSHTPVDSSRWVRGMVGDTVVVDSRSQVIVWEEQLPVPRYLFLASDVDATLLVETTPPERLSYHHPNGEVTVWFDIVAEGRTLNHAAWIRADFPDHIGVTWKLGKLSWFEEAQEVFEHPHDPFVHLDAYPSTRRVTVSSNGVVLADSTRAIFLWETDLPVRYYIPRDDVNLQLLTATDTESVCPYKGFATDYWSTADIPDIAWSYPEPFFPYRNIAEHVAFFSERVDISIDGAEQARPVLTEWPARERLGSEPTT
ncbi:DUF427 domain-containing protein [soil metagenome]